MASKQQDELVTELLAKLLEKDNEIERLRTLIQCLADPEEDKASETNDVGRQGCQSQERSSTLGLDETGHGSHDKVRMSGSGMIGLC